MISLSKQLGRTRPIVLHVGLYGCRVLSTAIKDIFTCPEMRLNGTQEENANYLWLRVIENDRLMAPANFRVIYFIHKLLSECLSRWRELLEEMEWENECCFGSH